MAFCGLFFVIIRVAGGGRAQPHDGARGVGGAHAAPRLPAARVTALPAALGACGAGDGRAAAHEWLLMDAP